MSARHTQLLDLHTLANDCCQLPVIIMKPELSNAFDSLCQMFCTNQANLKAGFVSAAATKLSEVSKFLGSHQWFAGERVSYVLVLLDLRVAAIKSTYGVPSRVTFAPSRRRNFPVKRNLIIASAKRSNEYLLLIIALLVV